MAAAVTEVRREVQKAALVPSVVDGAVVTLLLNVALRIVDLPFPEMIPLSRLPGVDAVGTFHVAIPVALVVGIVVAVVEYSLRMEESPIDQFERVNPSVAEALRTARDAVEADRTSKMAVALYDDVLARLKSTSSVELLPTRRVFVTLFLALLLSVASIQVAITDLQIDVLNGNGSNGNADFDDSDQMTELQNGSAILGDPEDVTAGSEELNATLSGVSGGGDEPSSSADAYDSSGFAGDPGVESQRAGYLADETLEEAELIRDYTLKIRDQDDD
ncbi:hypothetical protein GJR99_02880 [Haloferax sp. MBLA0078]|uniref:Uncharacterized protein n=2 Tax=Haloferacaceae TaxID=1644056 RepID=A0A6A8G4L9_9EURY|nr:hypothetical protein Hfx1150_02895 [Haloferax sp. CBA1150]MRW95518.1 hypothetical protein [Haloferax marinum]